MGREEQRLQESGLGPDVARLIQQENRDLYTDLMIILQREVSVTLAVLKERYGLGSPTRSAFALDLLTRVRLSGICLDLSGMRQDSEDRIDSRLHLIATFQGCKL